MGRWENRGRDFQAVKSEVGVSPGVPSEAEARMELEHPPGPIEREGEYASV